MEGAALCKRYLKMKGERYNFDSNWERMAPYLSPSRMGIITKLTPGDRQTRGVYDSTTMMAAEMMAMFIAGHVINPSQRWLGYELRDPVIKKMDQPREWMEECRDRYLTQLGASAFYAEGPESLIDYGGFGTGFLLQEEAPQPTNRIIHGFRGFHFRAEKTGRFVIAEGADGLVDTAMREFELSARVAHSRWPDGVSEGVRTAATAEPDKPYKFVHGIVPRPRNEQTNGAKGMPWGSYWAELDSKKMVHESGYKVFPAAVPRYHRTPGEVYGRGRGDLAFPDTWTLNTAKKMGLEDWALKIKPPVMVRHDSVIGTLRLVPGGPTSINSRGGPIRDAIMPWETGSNPEVSHIKEEELRRSIREIFFVDSIRQLLEVNKSEMTAFEFARKLELLFRLMGPVYGRMEWEYLYRIADNGFEIMLNAGAFSPPPPEVMETDGQIDVVFQNPIAKAQRAGDSEAFLLATNDLAPFGQMFPEVWDRFDPDKVSGGVADIRGVASTWTRSEKEIKALRAARAAENAEQKQMDQTGALAEAAGKAAPLVKVLADKVGTQTGAGVV